jgi:dihydroorotate dehydrogenase
MLYKLIRPLIFSLDAETAHEATLELLNQLRWLIPRPHVLKPRRVMGLDFPNPVGLAAGLDKNGDYLRGLAHLGFGFIEVGTVTPRHQPGNPKPRLFRLRSERSIINRMGFNNAGIDHLLDNLQGLPRRDYILGINIGKNLATPVDRALDDYRLALRRVYLAADYVTLNISSPNTPGLRKLQDDDALKRLLSGVSEARKALQDRHQVHRPLALKVAPDLDDNQVAVIADLLREYRIDGLIATNTTLDRSAVAGHPLAAEAGGLSGEALKERSRDILLRFRGQLGADFPIISVGGIDSPEEARLRFDLGADLIQIYSALIYEGPGLIRRILRAID